MAKVLLISSPEQHMLMEAGDRPPLGLLYLAGEVNNTRKHIAAISDLNHDNYKDLKKKIEDINPNFIGMSTSTPYYEWWSNYAKHLKYNYPKIKLIAGGPHATVRPLETLQFFDYVVMGEGENAIKDILDKKYPEKSVIKNPVKSLDDLSGPDWTAVNLDDYGINQEGLRTMTLMSSRSCRQQCFFCTKNILSVAQKVQSTEKTIRDVKELKSFGFDSLYFVDDCFTERYKRVTDLCNRLKTENVTWRATGRTDQITPKILDVMKRGGMRSISFGLEHMDDEVLKRIQKRNTAENNTYAVQLAKQKGLKVRGSFILNLPYSTEKTMRDTLKFAIDNNIDYADFYSLIAYPGTYLYEHPEKYGATIIDKNYSFHQSGNKTNVRFNMPLDEYYEIADDIRSQWKKFKGSEVPWEAPK